MKNILPRKCLFCKNEAAYSPLPDMEIHAVKVFFCWTCRAEYLYWRDGFLANYSLYTTLEEKTYRWTFAGPTHQLWYVGEPGEPGLRINNKMELLKTFSADSESHVTPQNIQNKIRTILVLL